MSILIEVIHFFIYSWKKLHYLTIDIIVLTLIDISQTVVNFDRPAEALRAAVFHGANQFHLFVLSLPGQVLLDHCNELAKQMYVFTVFIQV